MGQNYREAGSLVCGQSPAHEVHSNRGVTRRRNQATLVLVVQVHPGAIWGQSIPSPYLNFLLLKMRQLDVRAFSSFNTYAWSSVYVYFLTQNPI